MAGHCVSCLLRREDSRVYLTIKEIYNKNQIFVKVSQGICQPFETTKGLLQGETNSPLLFNIFVDKITKVFDQSCDPVSINNTPQSCLLWSDDLLLFSISAKGLQNSIDKMCLFYAPLGLEIILKKLSFLYLINQANY